MAKFSTFISQVISNNVLTAAVSNIVDKILNACINVETNVIILKKNKGMLRVIMITNVISNA
jgi:hypothetical protein